MESRLEALEKKRRSSGHFSLYPSRMITPNNRGRKIRNDVTSSNRGREIYNIVISSDGGREICNNIISFSDIKATAISDGYENM